MTFTPKTWQDGSVANGRLNAAAMIDLETRLAAYTDKTMTIVTRTSNSGNVSSANTGTTLTNDDTLLIPVSGNSTDMYYFEYFLLAAAGNATMDLKVAWSVPAGTTMKWSYGFIAGATGFPGSPYGSTSLALTVVYTQGSTATYPTISGETPISGSGWIFVGGTSGNVNMQWAQNTSDAGNLSLSKGSFIRYQKLI